MILAAGLRLGIVLSRPGDLATDPDGYLAHARMLTDGFGFAGPYTQKPTAFRPPGYTLMIALVPGSADLPERSVGILHVAMGVLTVLATRQLAEQLGLSTGRSNLAALLVACDPLLIRYSALPMSEVTSAWLLTTGLFLFTRYRKAMTDRTNSDCVAVTTHSESGTPDGIAAAQALRNAVAAGILFGLAALVRPVALVVVALLTAAMLAQTLSWILRARQTPSSRQTEATVRRSVVLALMPALIVAGVMMPWIIRNGIQFGKFIPATTHGGYTLALGNNPDYYRDVVRGNAGSAWSGDQLAGWQQRMIRESEADGVPVGNEPAADAWYYRVAADTIRDDPAGFLGACLLRLRRFWSIETAADSELSPIVSRLVAGWYLILWAGVAAALIAAILRRSVVPTSDLWLTVAAFLLVHTFFWTDARMRAPLMPILSVLAVIGARSLQRRFRAIDVTFAVSNPDRREA